jgi:hypothetical protein
MREHRALQAGADRPAATGRRRLRRRPRRAAVVVAAVAAALAVRPAAAIVPGQTDPNLFVGDWAGMDWGCVYNWRGSSGVGVDDFWLLTAAHVGGWVGSSTVTIDGRVYTAVEVAAAPNDPGHAPAVDLKLIRLDNVLPKTSGLYSGSFPTFPAFKRLKCIMIGYGKTGEDHDSYYTMTGGGGVKRWGTNKIAAESRVDSSGYSSECIRMNFDSGATTYECGLGSGDSGGGTFVEVDGTWLLAGINAYVGDNGTPGHYVRSWSVSVPAYHDWITDVLPDRVDWQRDPNTVGDWGVSGNWSPQSPTAAEDVHVDNGGSVVVTESDAHANYLYLGGDANAGGAVSQAGGTLTVTQGLHVGFGPGSTGQFSVAGLAAASIGRMSVGFDGNGAFSQTGGTVTVAGDLVIGVYPGSTGACTVSGGTLTAGGIEIGREGAAAFEIADAGATVNVTQSFVLGGGTLTAAAGSAIHMSGSSFAVRGDDAAAAGGLAAVGLVVEGGTETVCTIEAPGRDVGLDPAGWEDNFVLGGLTLGAGPGAEGRAALADHVDNHPGEPGAEALYVDTLEINAGASIWLGDGRLYYRHTDLPDDPNVPRRLFRADATLDGQVGPADLSVLADNWGTASGMSWPTGDLTGDGEVGAADLSLIADDWGKGQPPEETVFGVCLMPEPASAAVLLIAAAALTRRRRRQA